MKCHQRVIREQREKEESDANLFGRWWENLDIDISKAVVRETNYATARDIILKYEYLGTMPNACKFFYGIFFENVCGGVLIYTPPQTPSLAESVCGKAWKDSVIQIARGACVHWAHPHSASKLIGVSLKLVQKRGYRIAIAFSDPAAGEIGTVYQATNWLYCGWTAKRPDYYDIYGSKIFFGKCPDDAIRVDRPRKRRYVYLMGKTKAEKKKLMKSLLWEVEPYPKRDELEI